MTDIRYHIEQDAPQDSDKTHVVWSAELAGFKRVQVRRLAGDAYTVVVLRQRRAERSTEMVGDFHRDGRASNLNAAMRCAYEAVERETRQTNLDRPHSSNNLGQALHRGGPNSRSFHACSRNDNYKEKHSHEELEVRAGCYHNSATGEVDRCTLSVTATHHYEKSGQHRTVYATADMSPEDMRALARQLEWAADLADAGSGVGGSYKAQVHQLLRAMNNQRMVHNGMVVLYFYGADCDGGQVNSRRHVRADADQIARHVADYMEGADSAINWTLEELTEDQRRAWADDMAPETAGPEVHDCRGW